MPKMRNPAPKAVIDKKPAAKPTPPPSYFDPPAVVVVNPEGGAPAATAPAMSEEIYQAEQGHTGMVIQEVKDFDEAATEEFVQTGSTTGEVFNPSDAKGPSDLAQAIAVEEGALAPPAEFVTRFVPEFTTPEDLIAHFESLGFNDLTNQLIQNLQNAKRWEENMAVQRQLEEDAKVEVTLEIVDAGSEEDPFVPHEPYFHPFTKEDVIAMVVAAIEGKAEGWDAEAYADSQKGAGSPTTQNALRWGAGQLREIANIIREIPEGEMRTPVVPPAEA